MTLSEIKIEFQKDPSKRICRKYNHKPHNYMPIYFTFDGYTLMVHDQDEVVHGRETAKGKVAAFQTSTHDDWMLY